MDKIPAFGGNRRLQHASTRPDYALWAVKEAWTVSEAGKLLCGRNPYDKIPGPQTHNRERRVIDVIDQTFEAAQRGEIKVLRSALLPIHLLVDPPAFVRWAVRQGLQIPDELASLQSEEHAPEKRGTEAMIKERVVAVARTLWIMAPALTVNEIATHRAMRQLVSDQDAAMTDKLRWIAECRYPS